MLGATGNGCVGDVVTIFCSCCMVWNGRELIWVLILGSCSMRWSRADVVADIKFMQY